MALSSNNAHHKGDGLVDLGALADEDMRQKHRPRYASAPVMRALLTTALLILVGTVVVLTWDAGDGVAPPPGGNWPLAFLFPRALIMIQCLQKRFIYHFINSRKIKKLQSHYT